MGTFPTEEQIRDGPFRDFVPHDNTLSVWFIENDKSNLEQVVVALASTRDSFSNFDYVLVDEALLTAINIRIEQTDGDTPDQEANTRWHRDLVEFTESKAIELIKATIAKGKLESRIPEKRIAELIQRAVDAGRLDRTKLKKGLAAKLKT